MTGAVSFRKLALCGICAASLAALGAQAVNSFRPPRLAVVDIAYIFDHYQKKIDRQSELEGATKELEGKLKKLEDEYNNILEELKLVQSGTPEEEDLRVRKARLEFEVKQLKQSELAKLRRKQFEFLKEIQGEITSEIEVFFKANDLDLIIEKRVKAEATPNAPSFEWPIVHFVKPEYEITNEITERLNRRYTDRKIGPPVGPPAPPSSPAGPSEDKDPPR